MAIIVLGILTLFYHTSLVASQPCPVPIPLPVLLNVTRVQLGRNARNARTTTLVGVRSQYSTTSVVWKAKYGDGEYPVSPWDDDLEAKSTYYDGVGMHKITFGRFGAEISRLILAFDVHCTQLVLDLAFIPNSRFVNLRENVSFGRIVQLNPYEEVEANSTWSPNITLETDDAADLLQFEATLVSYRNDSTLSDPTTKFGSAVGTSSIVRGNSTVLQCLVPFHVDDMVVRVHGLWLPTVVQDAVQSIHTRFHVAALPESPPESNPVIQVTTCQYRDQGRYRLHGQVLIIPQRALTADCLYVRIDANPMKRVNVAEMDASYRRIENILEASHRVVRTYVYQELMYIISPNLENRHFYVSVNTARGSVDKLIQLSVYHPVRVAGGITPPFIYISEPLKITFTCEVNGDHILDYGIYVRRTWSSDEPENWRQYVRPGQIRTLTMRDRYLLYKTSVVITPGQVRAMQHRREVIFCGVKSEYNHSTFAFNLTP